MIGSRNHWGVDRRLIRAGQASSPGGTNAQGKEGTCATAAFSRDGPGGSDGGARQCRDQPTSRIPPLLSHLAAGYFAAAGIFAPVRSPKGGQFPPLSRAVTQVIPRHISACSPPHPPSILVFSTGPEVWEVSCIADLANSSVAFGTYNTIEPWS